MAYGGALDHEFVFDDWPLVVENQVVTWSPARATELFAHPSEGISYRPVRMMSYMVDHWIAGGVDPVVFHASNLFYHAAAALALYALALRLIGSIGGALLAAAFFAVHPLGSEAVAYVSGRRDLLAGLFCLLALLAWWALCEGGRTARRPGGRAALIVAMIAAFVLALGAKENAVVFPVLAALLFVLHARRGGTSISPTWATWSVFLLLSVALYVVVEAFYLDRVVEALARLRGEPLAPQPALTLSVLGRYARLAVWPTDLSADYRPPAWPLPVSGWDPPAVAAGLVLLAALCAAAWLLWRGRVAGAGLLWFFVALLPVSQIVPYREIVSEHNTYLPLAGLALAVGDAGAWLGARRPWLVGAAGLGLIGLLTVGTYARADVWRDDQTLWSVTLEHRPNSVRARHNLGVVLARRGALDEARELLIEAREADPQNLDVIALLATLQERLGNPRAALALARQAVQIHPDAKTETFLGWTYVSRGRDVEARAAFQRALKHRPRFAEARRGIELLRERARQRRYLRRGSPS